MALRVSVLAQASTIFCPCCGGSPDAFLPMPPAYTKECAARGVEHPLDAWETLNLDAYLCPQCGATDRDRLQVLFLEAIVQPGMCVLEIAPSAPVRNWLKSIGVAYRCCDLEREDVDDKTDIVDMTCYADDVFDIVICSHVLEHIPDDNKAMREIQRVLAPSGVALLLVPISLLIENFDEDPTDLNEAERWRRFGQGDHVRIYGQKGFENRLTDSGFRVKTFAPKDPAQFGLSNTTKLYLGYV